MRTKNKELRIRKSLWMIGPIIFTALFTTLVLGTLSDRQPTDYTASIRALSGFTYEIEGGEGGSLTLPHSFNKLSPRTAITLYAEVEVRLRECLYIKTVYTPLRLYADDVLIYECGQEGSYPAFMLDPPTIVTTVPLPDKDGAIALRFEFLSPSQRGEVTLPAVLVGREVALIVRLASRAGFSLLFSILLIFMGLALVSIALILLCTLQKGLPFIQLGVFALLVGMWGLGECNLTAFLIPYPSLLYMMAFTGLFTVAIPLLRFVLLVLNPQPPVRITLISARTVMCAAAAGALLLQLTGTVGLHRSMYLFHVLVPLSFVLIGGCVLWEYFRHRNMMARCFTVPMLVMAAASVLELVNYQLRFTDVLSLFFQLGMLVFIFLLGVTAGQFTIEAMQAETEKNRLEIEIDGVNLQLELQREQYARIAQNIEQTKMLRHDMRHQLTAIGRLTDEEKVQSYVAELLGALPEAQEHEYCKNHAVNAVVDHYLAAAAREGVNTDARLVIPETAGRVSEMDLCIIMGNLLENAVDACRRAEKDGNFIRVRSGITGDYLSIIVENSFDGLWNERDGVYFSRKSEVLTAPREGIGLSSVKAVCGKYDGLCRVEITGNVWCSSAMVDMGG